MKFKIKLWFQMNKAKIALFLLFITNYFYFLNGALDFVINQDIVFLFFIKIYRIFFYI